MLWWAFFLSGMIDAKLPSILNRRSRKTIVHPEYYVTEKHCKLLYMHSQCVLMLESASCASKHSVQLYLRVMALATGSLLWMTENTLLTNSSTLRIFSKCFSLCCVTFSTHRRRKLLLKRETDLWHS